MNSKDKEPAPTPASKWETPLRTPLYKWWIHKTVEQFSPECAIETGALRGEGTTKIISELLPLTSIEADGNHVATLRQKYAHVADYQVLHGYSTLESDGDPVWQCRLWDRGAEPSEEGLLKQEASKVTDKCCLFSLDSHWTMGFTEFRILFDFWHECHLAKPWIVFLDDVTNLKHRPTMRFLEIYPELDIPVVRKERWARLILDPSKV